MRLYLFIISNFFVGSFFCKQVEKHPDNVEFLNQNAVNPYSGTFKDIFFSEPDSTNNDTLNYPFSSEKKENLWFIDLIPYDFYSHPEFGMSDESWPIPNIELIQYRTENSKTFFDIENVYHTITSGGKLHYMIGNQFYDIQQAPTQSINRFGIYKSDLPLYTNLNDGSTILRLHPVGDSFVLGASKSIHYLDSKKEEITNLSILTNGLSHINGNELSLTTTQPTIISKFEYTYWSFRFNLEITSPLSVPSNSEFTTFRQRYFLPDGYDLSYDFGEMTEKGWYGTLKIVDNSGTILGKISPAQIFDSYESDDKNESSNHIVPGYYHILKTPIGNYIDIFFESEFLRRTDLVYPITIDPTVSNTYASNSPLQDKNTQFNSNCQQSLIVNIPITGFQVTGSTTSYRIWAKGYITQSGTTTYYADIVEQRSRVGCGSNWTATQSGSGINHSGSSYTYTPSNNGMSYNLTNQNMCNGCYPNQNTLTYKWQGYQTYFPINVNASSNVSGCVTNYQELVTNTWQVTTTYVSLPTINAVANQTLCSGNLVAAIGFSGNASSYSWTNDNTAIGLAASGSGNINSFTATNNTSNPITATITVTPINNPCSGNPITFTITVNPLPIANISPTTSICSGNTASFTITGTSGAVVTYNMNGGSNNTETLTGGSATISVTNATSNQTLNLVSVSNPITNCSQTLSATETINVTPPPTIAVNNAIVCAGNNATLNATPSAGGGSYLWSTSETTPSINVSTAGTYSVSYSVGAGCTPATGSGSVTITPAPTVSVNNASICAGATATLTASPSTGGGTYSWSTGATTQSITTSTAGTYTVNYSVGAGCTSGNGTGTVSITPSTSSSTSTTICASDLPYSWNGLIFNAAGSQTATLVNVGGCDSLATLSLTVLSPSVSINTPLSTVNVSQSTQLNAVGSPAGGTYTWSPAASLSPSTGATVNATPNTTTTYTVIYDLGNGCTASATTTITVNPITLSVNGTTICSGASTTLTATPSVAGGTYLWSPGGQTTQTISVSPNSNVVYTCVYTLNGQTVNSNPASITVLPKPVISVNSPTICSSQSATLSVTANPSGGSYLWQPGGQTTSSLSVNPTSTSNYTVIYTLNGCSDTATSIVTVNPIPTVSVNNQTICSGQSATLTASPSVSGGTFLWSSSQNTSSITVSPTSITTYNVLYSINGCNATGSGTVTVNAVPTVSVTNTTICAGESATLTASPSIAGGTYSWINQTSTSNSINISPQSTTNYSLTYTVNGCTSQIASGTVTVKPIPSVNINNAVICAGESATLTATPSLFGGTYLWVPNGQSGSSITVSPSTTTSYGVTYTLNGCQSSPASSTVTVSPKPTISFSADKLSGCAPLIVNFSNNNTNQNSCLWNMGNGQSFSGCNNNFTFDQGGCYDITLTASENGCSNSLTLQDYICVESLPNASFTVFPIAFSQDNQTLSFNNTSTGATTYSWDFGDGSFSNVLNPDHLFINTLQGYLVTLTVSSASGCSDVTQVYIGYNEGENIYIPNTFTPDADGFNQTFKPIFTSGFDPFNYEMLIYNRWGELIFETRDVNWGWDGSYRIAGRDVQQGIYTYKIAYKNPKLDQRKSIVGHVTLIK